MKMIPDYIEENSPPGERLVFSRLQNSNNGWITIHSLDLAPYNRNKRTELDFVVIVPKHGILCVEVKSHKNIHFDGNRWQPESITRSPFKQALDARYAFHRRIKDRLPGRFGIVPVMHICIFPMSDYNIQLNASISPHEFIDRRSIASCRTADDFCENLRKKLIEAIDSDPQVSPLRPELSIEEIEEITRFCYPVRKRKPEKREEVRRRYIEMERVLREQQKPALNLAACNNRVLIEGGAGTGKSFIGMEVAKRNSEAGLRVAYVCYNKLIGKWIDKQLSCLNQPNLIAGSLHSILLELTDIVVPDNPDSDWWDKIAPTLIEDKLTDPDVASVTLFDYIVIDEAQDILSRSKLWDCLKLLIDGGISEGKYMVLGDFINQSLIINREALDRNLIELKNCSAMWQLTENCRNYSSIGDVALMLSGSDKNTWTGYMRQGGRIDNWHLESYVDDADQVRKIRRSIQLAKNNGFKSSEITLLTFRAIDKSIIEKLVCDGVVVSKAIDLESGEIRYATINAFKGMENKVIIITDVVISPQNSELERKIFYTGLTRATEVLCVFCRSGSVDMLKKWVLEHGSAK